MMRGALFFKLFPPPKILSLDYCGIHISETAVYGVRVKPESKRSAIIACSFPLAEGDVSAGYIHSIENVSKVVMRCKEALGASWAKVALPDGKLYVFRMPISEGSDSDVRSNIEFKIEEYAPLTPGKVVFEYKTLEPEKRDAIVTAFPKGTVDSYGTAVELGGFKICGFVPEPWAVSRTLAPFMINGTTMLVHCGRYRSSISIICKGVVHFNSILSLGGNDIWQAIENYKGIDLEKAKLSRQNLSLPESEIVKTYFEAASSVLSLMRDEVKRVSEYWHEHEGGNCPIEHIVFTGRDSAFPGFVPYIGSATGIQALLYEPVISHIGNESIIESINRYDVLDYAVAIGLAL